MPAPHLAKWTVAGDLVFFSGQLPFDGNRAITETEISGQTHQVLSNLSDVIVEAGLRLSDVVKTTVWLRRGSDFLGFNESYAAFFGDHRPARSTVVSDLVAPQALIEIEAIARRPRP